MVQMGDNAACSRAISNLGSLNIFGNRVTLVLVHLQSFRKSILSDMSFIRLVWPWFDGRRFYLLNRCLYS